MDNSFTRIPLVLWCRPGLFQEQQSQVDVQTASSELQLPPVYPVAQESGVIVEVVGYDFVPADGRLGEAMSSSTVYQEMYNTYIMDPSCQLLAPMITRFNCTVITSNNNKFSLAPYMFKPHRRVLANPSGVGCAGLPAQKANLLSQQKDVAWTEERVFETTTQNCFNYCDPTLITSPALGSYLASWTLWYHGSGYHLPHFVHHSGHQQR